MDNEVVFTAEELQGEQELDAIQTSYLPFIEEAERSPDPRALDIVEHDRDRAENDLLEKSAAARADVKRIMVEKQVGALIEAEEMLARVSPEIADTDMADVEHVEDENRMNIQSEVHVFLEDLKRYCVIIEERTDELDAASLRKIQEAGNLLWSVMEEKLGIEG